MGNSYEFGKKTGCDIIEGFLITEFHSKKEFDVVGHVWNQYNAQQFDLTVSLTNDPDVKAQYYYPLKEYKSSDALIVPSQKFLGEETLYSKLILIKWRRKQINISTI